MAATRHGRKTFEQYLLEEVAGDELQRKYATMEGRILNKRELNGKIVEMKRKYERR
jgi:hypothetical protein